MIEVLLSILLSIGAVSKQEAKSLQNNEGAVIQKAEQYNIVVPTSSKTCIVNAEDNGL